VRRVSVLLAYERLYERENVSRDILQLADCFGSFGAAPDTGTLTLSALGINTGRPPTPRSIFILILCCISARNPHYSASGLREKLACKRVIRA
jgi:hypothetical protein